MDLFEINNKRAIPSTHALLISPFKEIWEYDLSKDKAQAIKDLSYVELLCSPKKSNPFAGYSEEERPKKVLKEVYGNEDHIIDDILISAVLKYRELLEIASPAYALYVSGANAVHKLRAFLDTVNFNERNLRTGLMVLKPKDITSALKELPDVERAMQLGRDKVQGELNNNTKTRNLREIGAFER